jgi:murein DD-endopeptidase MepM/ murein hydrolase activator NlpD
MAREARGIYNAALKGGLNPAFVAGLASAESGFGSRGYAVGKNNPFGLGVHLGWRFPSYAAATTKLAQTLNSLDYPKLFKQGGLAGIISQYTPASDGNDEGAHFRNIVSGGRRTGGDPQRVYVGQGAGGMMVPGGGGAPAPATTPGVQAPAPRGANSIDGTRLAALLGQQYAASRSGNFDPALSRMATMEVANVVGQRLRAGSGGSAVYGGTQQPSEADTVSTAGGTLPAIPRSARQPKMSKWGGPEDHGSRALGDWQSDMAYDLGGPTGTLVTSPLAGTVVKIGGRPGAYKGPQFSGYGVTVDYGGGRQAFFKHLGSKGANIRPGARIAPGTVIGGLDATTAGGPHLHLGASNRGFLNQILSYYTG